ncbi:MAG: DNA adenine methylase [Candidatus Izemoplasmatales bacterium]
MIEPKENKLSPLLKYPGGKDKELKHIIPALPQNCNRYYEPFVGGGAVYFALDAEQYLINDKSAELMNLYKYVKDQDDEFLKKVKDIQHNWDVMRKVINQHSDTIIGFRNQYKEGLVNKQRLEDLISEFVLNNNDDFNGMLQPRFNVGIDNFIHLLIKSFKNKIVRMTKLEDTKGELSDEDALLNIEASFKSAFYTHFRYLYNNTESLDIGIEFATAIYFFIREYCYSSMFRYNSKGEFNVPYGGISYNKKSMQSKIEYFQSEELIQHLNNTVLSTNDFKDFVKEYEPQEDDFMFLDPPYDTEFSTYANMSFEKNDQERLANYLKNECDAHFMLVIKNTEFISRLYPQGLNIKNNRRLYVSKFDKKYFVSFKDRNNKDAEHLLITNYPFEVE